MQCPHHGVAVGLEAPAFKFVDPVGRCAMAALAIAAGTGGQFVLDPGRSTFDPGHKMLRGGWNPLRVNLTSAPDTARTVTDQNEAHPGGARQIAITGGVVD